MCFLRAFACSGLVELGALGIAKSTRTNEDMSALLNSLDSHLTEHLTRLFRQCDKAWNLEKREN